MRISPEILCAGALLFSTVSAFPFMPSSNDVSKCASTDENCHVHHAKLSAGQWVKKSILGIEPQEQDLEKRKGGKGGKGGKKPKPSKSKKPDEPKPTKEPKPGGSNPLPIPIPVIPPIHLPTGLGSTAEPTGTEALEPTGTEALEATGTETEVIETGEATATESEVVEDPTGKTSNTLQSSCRILASYCSKWLLTQLSFYKNSTNISIF